MSPKALKIALAISVALNLFAVAGGAAAVLTRASIDRKVEDQRRPGRDDNVRQIIDNLDPAVRGRVHEALRASALAARPDFEAARTARREAIATTTVTTTAFDPAAVTALLDRSRAAELRGRARLEHDAVALLATLEPDDRKALGVILSRHRKSGGTSRGPRGDGHGSEGRRSVNHGSMDHGARDGGGTDRPAADGSASAQN